MSNLSKLLKYTAVSTRAELVTHSESEVWAQPEQPTMHIGEDQEFLLLL